MHVCLAQAGLEAGGAAVVAAHPVTCPFIHLLFRSLGLSAYKTSLNLQFPDAGWTRSRRRRWRGCASWTSAAALACCPRWVVIEPQSAEPLAAAVVCHARF